jgi:exoribonuclease R
MAYTHKQLIELIRTRTGKPMMVRELMRLLKLKTEDRHDLKRALNELVMSGNIVKTRGNRYGLSEKMDLETGRFQAHPAGYGFVIPEKKGRTDIYISARSRLDAMDGDTVVVRVTPPAGKEDHGKRKAPSSASLNGRIPKSSGLMNSGRDRRLWVHYFFRSQNNAGPDGNRKRRWRQAW